MHINGLVGQEFQPTETEATRIKILISAWSVRWFSRPTAVRRLRWVLFYTLSREFYMGPHKQGTADENNGFYHSSYVAVNPSKVLEQCWFKPEDQTNSLHSGHYKPVDTNMLEVLQALQMYGVDCHGIMVEDFNGKYPQKASDFLQHVAIGMFCSDVAMVESPIETSMRFESDWTRDRQQMSQSTSVTVLDSGYNAAEE